MGGRTHELLVTLQRDSPNVPWGFSLVGGADVNTPLIVTRVGFGSPANGVLQRGDIITKVANYDARDIRHEDAQTLFKNAGGNVRIVVQREHTGRHNTSTGSSRSSSRNYSPLSVSPHLSPRGGGPSLYSPGGRELQPYLSTPYEVAEEGYYSYIPDIKSGQRKDDGNPDVHVVNQPYRTTPLVLPGAKIKKEPGVSESYLRHHPNPSVRAPPHHLDAEHILKQKVADTVLQRIGADDPKKQVVHKQFNSPIGLYSDANVADTLTKQTGVNTSLRKPFKYDPAKSEIYKAIQEEKLGDNVQEVNVPPQSRVFSPNKNVIPTKKPQQQNYVNNLGESAETIHQSGSFKRLMWSVLAESDY